MRAAQPLAAALALAAIALMLSYKAVRADTVRASFYGFESGRKTASGQPFKPLGMTCAHRTLPLLKTRLRVTYNGRSAVCVVNDRGPYIAGCGLDLSLGMARKLGLEKVGVALVDMEVLP